jgi:hypothetical protein
MTHMTCADLTAPNGAADGVITTTRLRKEGWSASAIAARCQPGGPWRRLLPGVILLHRGEPTRRQLQRAAVAQAGSGSMVTGIDSLREQGACLPLPSRVRVLVPASRRLVSPDFAIMDRTTRLPEPVLIDGLPFAPPARAAMDVARREPDKEVLRRQLTLPVYYGLCTADELRAELEVGNQRGTAAVRDLLRHLGSMGDTYVQGLARRLARWAPLPPPTWNMTVCDRLGRPVGIVDAWWDEVAVGWQFGARRTTHAEPKLAHLALTAAGVVLVRTPPDRLRDDPEGVVRELTSAFGRGARRKRPLINVLGLIPAA